MSPPSARAWPRRLVLAGVAALVLGFYIGTAHSGMLEVQSGGRGETYYNLLVRGLANGQLNLPRPVPPGLAHLSDPFDPVANAPYRITAHGVHDLSYYRGRLYLYFGITPALVLFGPVAALTGHYLYHREAAVVFCFGGFLLGLGLLRSAQRRYFPATGTGALAAGAILFGLGTGLPLLLARAEVYEVAIACGYFFTVAAWAAVWRALHRPDQRGRWLLAASAAYGLAVASRPTLLPGAIGLLVLGWPPTSGRRRLGPNHPPPGGRRPPFRDILCLVLPLAVVGALLLLYNFLRFDRAGEFGQHYQLTSFHRDPSPPFSLRYLWFNLRVYFFEPLRWHGKFPFLRSAAIPPLPRGHKLPEDPYGALVDAPVLWLALALPLGWRNRRAAGAGLRSFVWSLALMGGACALTLGLYFGSCSRYQAEFIPALGLGAALGLLALEQALAGRPVRRRLARAVWGALLAGTVIFNLLAATEHYAEATSDTGMALISAGRWPEAIARLRRVEKIDPELLGLHVNLGVALAKSGQLPSAIAEFQTAIGIDPNSLEAQFSLAQALEQAGRPVEAIGHYQAAVRLNPRWIEARFLLANALSNANRVAEGAEQYGAILQLDPRQVPARINLGLALVLLGRSEEAVGLLRQALREKPDDPKGEAYLGFALAHLSRWHEAVLHYENALRRDPDNADLRFQWLEARRHLLEP